MSYTTDIKPEKRKGPDAFVKWIKVARFISWLLLGVCLFLIDQAKPRTTYFFDRLFDLKVYSFWDLRLVSFAYVIAAILFVVSLGSIVLNLMRLKRKSDKLSISLIISLIASTIYMLIYMSSFTA